MFLNRSVKFILIAVIASSPITADTVLLKDGSEITNVQTKLEAGNLQITLATGEKQIYTMAQVKSIRPGEIKLIIGEQIKEPMKESILDRPWALALQGVAPGWSGLYRSNHILGGLFMSGLEVYSIYRLIPWVKSPVRLAVVNRSRLILLSADGTLQAPQRLIANTVILNSLDLLQNPAHKGSYMSRSAFFNARKRAIGAVAFTLLADATMSVLLFDRDKVSITTPGASNAQITYSHSF